MGGPPRRPAQRGGDALARGGERGRRPRGVGARLLETAGGLAAGARAAERPGDRDRRSQDRDPCRSHRVWVVAAAAGHASPHGALAAAPALAAVSSAVRALLTNGALLALIVLLAGQITKRWMRYTALLLALCATLPSEVRTPGEFLVQYTISLAMAAAAIAFFRFFGRRNYLAYVLLLWLMALRVPMTQLFGTGTRALAMPGSLPARPVARCS